jgi:hypothetical protein
MNQTDMYEEKHPDIYDCTRCVPKIPKTYTSGDPRFFAQELSLVINLTKLVNFKKIANYTSLYNNKLKINILLYSIMFGNLLFGRGLRNHICYKISFIHPKVTLFSSPPSHSSHVTHGMLQYNKPRWKLVAMVTKKYMRPELLLKKTPLKT